MQARIAINSTLHNLSFTSWRELWQWLAKATKNHAMVEPIKTIGIVIQAHNP